MSSTNELYFQEHRQSSLALILLGLYVLLPEGDAHLAKPLAKLPTERLSRLIQPQSQLKAKYFLSELFFL